MQVATIAKMAKLIGTTFVSYKILCMATTIICKATTTALVTLKQCTLSIFYCNNNKYNELNNNCIVGTNAKR